MKAHPKFCDVIIMSSSDSEYDSSSVNYISEADVNDEYVNNGKKKPKQAAPK